MNKLVLKILYPNIVLHKPILLHTTTSLHDSKCSKKQLYIIVEFFFTLPANLIITIENWIKAVNGIYVRVFTGY